MDRVSDGADVLQFCSGWRLDNCLSCLGCSTCNDDGGKVDVSISEISPTEKDFAPMGKIIYGAKSKGDDTARLVTEAINSGFRHIATVRVKDNIRGWSVLLFVYLHDMMFAQVHFFRYLSLIDMVHNRVDFIMNTMNKE